MDEESMRDALNKIHDEALALIQLKLPPEVAERVERIHTLARYKFDPLGEEREEQD